MTIIKTSTSYFACASPATTAAALSSICFQPSTSPLFFCFLHGFISNQREFRLAVSKILKNNDEVRIVYGLIFYSIVRRLNLVSLRVGKVHGGNDLFVQNNLVVFPTIPELLPIRRSGSALQSACATGPGSRACGRKAPANLPSDKTRCSSARRTVISVDA
jgi:hypothetical protein